MTDDNDNDGDGDGGVEDTTTAVGGGQSAWNEVRPRVRLAAAERKTRLPLASPIARHRRTLFRPSVLDDKLAAVGVLAESSTLCARAADEDMSTPARQAS
ncbi:hypothetical protein EAG_07988 [Camponotus floridanus]|uniref:Uncharacterized protein n=1 Tax=Camponotus floridanus TaxID=104421 RepID=E2AIB3_CAMFO|nr:hypothetical protein EAG_07988 [Camponotus floridanus]